MRNRSTCLLVSIYSEMIQEAQRYPVLHDSKRQHECNFLVFRSHRDSPVLLETGKYSNTWNE